VLAGIYLTYVGWIPQRSRQASRVTSTGDIRRAV
jgi:hypothetical protein